MPLAIGSVHAQGTQNSRAVEAIEVGSSRAQTEHHCACAGGARRDGVATQKRSVFLRSRRLCETHPVGINTYLPDESCDLHPRAVRRAGVLPHRTTQEARHTHKRTFASAANNGRRRALPSCDGATSLRAAMAQSKRPSTPSSSSGGAFQFFAEAGCSITIRSSSISIAAHGCCCHGSSSSFSIVVVVGCCSCCCHD